MLKRCTVMAIHRNVGAALHDYPQSVQTISGCMPVTTHVRDLFTCSACANLVSSVDQNVRRKRRLVWRSLDPRLRATGFLAVLSIFPARHHGIRRCAPLLAQPRSRLRRNEKRFGMNRLATASAPLSQFSSAIFWESMMSPIGNSPTGMKHRPSVGRPFLSTSQTFIPAPAWILYCLPVSPPTTSK